MAGSSFIAVFLKVFCRERRVRVGSWSQSLKQPRFIKEVATGALERAACMKVKRFAERVAPVAQTTHPTQAGLARVLNSLVVPPFLRRGNWQFLLFRGKIQTRANSASIC